MAELRRAIRLVVRMPVLVWVPAVAYALGATIMLLGLRWSLAWALAPKEQHPIAGLGGPLAAATALLLAPAVSAVYNSVVLAAVDSRQGQGGGLVALRGRFWALYRRILTGGVLGLGVAAVAATSLAASGNVDLLLWLGGAAASAWLHLWFAASVAGGRGVPGAVAKSLQEFAARPSAYGPALALTFVAALTTPLLGGPWIVSTQLGSAHMWEQATALIAGLPAVAASAVARVAVFAAYSNRS